MAYQFSPRGVCSHNIDFDVDENGCVRNVKFTGGCHGNAQGIAKLAEGMPAEEVVRRLSGIRGGMKNTSCPDQLAKAVEKVLQK